MAPPPGHDLDELATSPSGPADSRQEHAEPTLEGERECRKSEDEGCEHLAPEIDAGLWQLIGERDEQVVRVRARWHDHLQLRSRDSGRWHRGGRW